MKKQLIQRAALWLCAAPLAAAQVQFRSLTLCQDPGAPNLCTMNAEFPQFPSTISPRRILMGDMDLDGDLDVVSVGSSILYFNNGDLSSPPATTPSEANGRFVDPGPTATGPRVNLALSNVADASLADLDGDGDLDVMMVTDPPGGGGWWALLNTRSGPGGTTAVFSLQDVRSNGWTLPISGSAPAAPFFQAVATADFDGDGDIDVMTGGTQGLHLLLNAPGAVAGTRVFTDVSATTVRLLAQPFNGINVEDLAAADFDGDGDIDVAIAGNVGLNADRRIAINNGPGLAFGFTALLPGAFGPTTSVAAGDLDRDGDVDLVYGHSAVFTTSWTLGNDVVYSNGGAGAFGAAILLQAGPSWTTDVAIGDVDEDGLLDIVASTRDLPTTPPLPSGTRLYVQGPALAFTDASGVRIDADTALLSTVGLSGECVALGDADLDLDLDILVGYTNQPSVGYFANRLFQLEIQRALPSVANAWTLRWEHFCDSGIPTGTLGVALIGVTLDRPVHVFPPGPFGVLTNANYVTLFLGNFAANSSIVHTFTISPANPAFVGAKIYAQSGLMSLRTNVARFSNVVETTLQ